jgi:hypothetical protein
MEDRPNIFRTETAIASRVAAPSELALSFHVGLACYLHKHGWSIDNKALKIMVSTRKNMKKIKLRIKIVIDPRRGEKREK